MDAVLNGVIALTTVWADVSPLLLDVAIKGLILLFAASMLVLTLRNASAAARHLVWCVAICGLLVLPVVTLVAPKWKVPGSPFISLMDQSATLPPARVSEAEVAPSVEATESVGVAGDGEGAGVVAAEGPSIAPRISSHSGTARPSAPAPTVPAAPATAGVAPPGPEAAGVALDWMPLLPAVWFVGAFVVLTWIVGGLLWAWMLVRSAREVTHGPVARLFDELSDELDLSGRVTLLRTNGATMPMVWGIRSKILLPADADDWTDARLRAVLLHELAHVKRRDYETQLVARLAGTLYWFNPLVWVAIHRMRVERELACDDHVLLTGSRASDYASHLLEIARSANGRAFASFGGVAMARRSRLSDRLLAVLDETRRRATVTPRMAVAAWAGAAGLLLPIAGAGFGTADEKENEQVAESAPAVFPESAASIATAATTQASHAPEVSTTPRSTRPVPASPSAQASVPTPVTMSRALPVVFTGPDQARCDWYARNASTSHWMSGEDDDYQVRMTMDDCRLEVEIAGDIVFNDEETDILDISRSGYFEIEEREDRSRRRIVIEPNSGGEVERRWFVDGDERQYDGEASSWLREMIPLLFRRIGLQAEERAARILDREGVDGVMQEISQIPSDYIARKYYQVLLTDGDLDAAQLRSIVSQAGAELESDYELAQLLIEVADNHPVDESVMVVYVEAAGSLESDYEQRRALDAILSRDDLSPDVAEAMLRLATDLESDYELAELLIAIMHRHPIDEALTSEFFDAVHTLDSDYEHNRVLKVAISEGAPNLQVLDLALESATHLDSDYERAELLLEVVRLYPVDQDVPSSYLVAAQSLGSDYELGRVLKFLIDNQRLSEDALGAVLDAALTLDSDYELGRVLKAILEQGPLNEQNLSAVLTSARSLESDYELANLLISVADNHRVEGDLRAMFMRSVDTISSDYERGRVLSALNPRGGQAQ